MSPKTTPPEKKVNTIEEDTITFKKSRFYSVLVVFAFAVGVLVGYIAWGRNAVPAVAVQPGIQQPAQQPTEQPATQVPVISMEPVISKVRHFKGDTNAPVTMIEFADFQCPFCGRYFAQTDPQINEQYVQSGKVRFGYLNLAFLGSESTWAAEAAECAADQDKFWEYHDKLYSSQSGENQEAFNQDNLKKFAQDLGLDTSAFNQCLDSGKYTQLIKDDISTANTLGIHSTPTFLINGTLVVGAQPFTSFQQVIDKALTGETPQ